MTTTFTDYTVTDPTDLTFLFTKLFLDSDHVRLFYKPIDGESGFVESSDFTGAGSSGAYVLTVNGAVAAALAIGDTVRVRRVTPSTPLVTFAPGTLRSSDLNLVVTQNLYRTEEATEFPIVGTEVVDGNGAVLLGLNVAQNAFDADDLRIENVAPALIDGDAVNLGLLTLAITTFLEAGAGGTLPAIGADDAMMYSASGEWVTGDPATIRTLLALGTAALRAVGVASDTEIPSRLDADGRYFQRLSALSELATDGLTATARTNLGLTSAATTDIGTSAGELVALDGSADLPAVGGKNLDLSEHTALNGNAGFAAVFLGNTQGNRTTGAGQLMSAGATRMKFETASGASENVNGGMTIHAVSSDKSWTAELPGDVTAVHEVEVSLDYIMSVTGQPIELRYTTDLDGVTGWTSLTFPRVGIPTATGSLVHRLHTKAFFTGPVLLELYAAGGANYGGQGVVGTPFISCRKLNN